MDNKYLLTLAVSALMLVACGDDVTEVNEIHQDGIAVLEAGLELSKQKCGTDNVGEMLYVTDSAEVYFCDGKSWQTTKGADGENGKDGVGKDGAPGKDGNDGGDGASCAAKTVTNEAGLKGLEVTCGETVVGTIWNGIDGNDGGDGTGCTLTDNGGGSVKIICGEGDNEIMTTIYKAVCGMKPYDPIKSFCLEGELYSCDGKSYDPQKQYCLKVIRDEVDIYSVEEFLTDSRDNEIYKTVKIGDQVWMAENLNYSVNLSERSWCGGGEDGGVNEGDCSIYGRLYTWAASVGKSENECGPGHECDLSDAKNEMGEVRGVCPEGWHLPTSDEWETLFTAVGGSNIAGKILKSGSGWYNDGNGEDAYGFSAFPAGYRDYDGKFSSAGNVATFWSASEFSGYPNLAIAMLLGDGEDANLARFNKGNGNAVRCLQD